MSFYFRKVTPKSERKLFPKIILGDLKKFHIIMSDDKKQFVVYADKMIELKKQVIAIQNKFIEFITETYGINKLTDKMRCLYKLDFDIFINELQKQKVNLSAKDKYDIFDIFKIEKNNILGLFDEMGEIQRFIDMEVFVLYGLEKEEIEIVKNDIRK